MINMCTFCAENEADGDMTGYDADNNLITLPCCETCKEDFQKEYNFETLPPL